MSTRQANNFLNKVPRGGKGATIPVGQTFAEHPKDSSRSFLVNLITWTIHLIPKISQHCLLTPQ